MAGAVTNWKGPPFSSVYTDTMGGVVNSLISDRLGTVSDLANNAWQNAMSYLQDLSNYDFEVPSISVSMDDITAPTIDFSSITAPTAPDIEEDITLPADPTLEALTDVSIADVEFPESMASMPDPKDGLGGKVEEAIWDRAVSRMSDELDKRLLDINSDWASRGFDMPPAMMAALMQEAQNDINKRQNDTSRDIMIEQARIAIEIYAQKVNAYRAAIEAKRNQLEAYVAQAQPTLEANKNLISKFSSEINAYTAKVSAQLQEADAKIKSYGTEGEVYGHKIRAEATQVQAEIDKYRVQIEKYRAETDIAYRNAQSNAENMLNASRITTEAMRSSATIAAQLSASAMAAVNTSVNWGFSGSASSSSSYQQGISYSEQQSRSDQYTITAQEK